MIKIYIYKILKYLRAYKSYYLPIQHTYSQHGEDNYILSLLGQIGIDKGFYIDVGSNQPTIISNTYKLYRKGWNGLAIEPNIELVNLHRKIRKNDICLPIACGQNLQISKIAVSKSSILSSITDNREMVGDFANFEYIPILPLDKITESLDIKEIDFFSLDVEGFEEPVLVGAKKTLSFTKIICIETNTEREFQKIDLLMQLQGFILNKKMGVNCIYINSKYFKMPF